MPNPNAAPGEPRREPASASDDVRLSREALDRHLSEMLARLQTAVEQPESPERKQEMTGVAGEYVLGLLEGMVADDGQLEAQLIKLGARTVQGNWQLGSELFIFLADEMALSLPTRLRALRDGQYKDVREFNIGMNKQLRQLIGRYRPRLNPHADRRPGPQPPSAAM
ncbi:MAG: hypothetical protein Q7R80_01285 [bacterium]|nr:hypothetical protein [bacterium]